MKPPEIDRGDVVPPADIQDAIHKGTILEAEKEVRRVP
jgi:hypothetical protein